MELTENKSQKKKRFSVYVSDSTLETARKWYEADNCGSISEYVGKAIDFYNGYVSSQKNPNYMPRIVISTLKNIIEESENRQCSQLYRVAVELSLLLNILAASNNFSKDDVRALRESCEEEVKKLNGTLRLDDAIRWQNS